MIEWAFRTLRWQWRPLVTMILILQGPVTLLSAFTQGRLLFNLGVPQSTALGASPPDFHPSAELLVLIVVVALVSSLILQPTLTAAIFRAGIGAYLGETPRARPSLRFGFRRFPSILLITVLTGLIVVAMAVPIVVLGIVTAVTSRSDLEGVALLPILFLVSAAIATAVAYVYVVIRLSFGITLVTAEGLRGRAALRRSWHLVEGRFWRVFGVGLVGGFLASVVTFAFATVADLFVDGFGVGASCVRSIAYLAGQGLAIPFTALLSIALFFSVRAEKEPFDPARDLAQLRARDPKSGGGS